MVSQAADVSLATLFYALTALIVFALCACNIYDLIKKCRRGDFAVNGGAAASNGAVTTPHRSKKTKEPDLTLTYCTTTILDEPLTGTIRVVNQNADAAAVEEEQQQPSTNVAVMADFGDHVMDLKSETSCAICLYEYAANDTVFRNDPQKCQHIFHTACILTWIQRNSPIPECPCCRASIAVTRQIFGTHDNGDQNRNSDSSAGIEIPVTTTTTNAAVVGTTTTISDIMV